MKYIDTERVVIKSWCNDPEESAIEQAKNLANLPFVFRHVVLLSDTHFGFGMPVGAVAALENIISPNMVGVDIGCSVSAYKTNLKTTSVDTTKLKEIMGEIRKTIPFGEGNYPDADMELVEYLESLEKEVGGK